MIKILPLTTSTEHELLEKKIAEILYKYRKEKNPDIRTWGYIVDILKVVDKYLISEQSKGG